MTALDSLDAALIALAERDKATPCHGAHSERWTSDNYEDREWSSHMCRMCPVLALCAAAADELKATAGVWGGIPRGTSAKSGRLKTTTTERKTA